MKPKLDNFEGISWWVTEQNLLTQKEQTGKLVFIVKYMELESRQLKANDIFFLIIMH